MLNKILSSWLQTYIKDIVHHDQVRFIPAMPGWFSISGLKNKSHDNLSRLRKKLWQILTCPHDKGPRGLEGTYLHIIRAILEGSTSSMIINWKSHKPILLKSSTKQGCSLFPLLNIVLEALVGAIWQEKQIKGIQKEISHTIPICRWQDIIHKQS